MEKILTIVVPTYNMEKYLERCLSSLLISDKEAFNTLEVLVVNDGSKDNSSTIAHSFQDKYPEVFTTIDKENGNYGSCINVALKIAKGKYIKILDADDCFNKLEFERFLTFLYRTDCDLILTDYEEVDLNRQAIKEHNFHFCMDTSISLESLLDIELQMHSITWKTRNLRSMGYYQTEGISYTDSEWGYFPLFTVKAISYFSCMLYKYTVGRIGQTMDKSVYYNNMWHNIKGLESMLLWYSNQVWADDIVHHVLKSKLLSRASSIYATYLIYGHNVLNISELKKLDSMLATEYTEIYHSLDECTAPIKLFKIPFIKDWHRNNCLGKVRLKIIRAIKYLFHN